MLNFVTHNLCALSYPIAADNSSHYIDVETEGEEWHAFFSEYDIFQIEKYKSTWKALLHNSYKKIPVHRSY